MLLGAVVLLYLGRIAAGGAGGQTAADMAALAAARSLASDPSTAPASVRASADAAARDNGARVVSLRIERTGAVATAVDVTTAVDVDGTLPVAGPQHRRVLERARAGVTYSAQLSAQAFRPVDLHGARGPLAAVAAAEAQIGWPYVWGGESRAEGGFDCSGLIDYAYAAAGLVLPGRPTAADLWRLAAAGDARCAGAGRPGVRRRRLRSTPPCRHVCRRRHGRGGSPHGRGCSLRAARRRRLGRLRAARRAAPGGDSDRRGRRACGAHPPGAGARHRSGARARGRGRCRFRSHGAGGGPAPSPGRPPGSARRRARRRLAGGGRSSPRVRARPRGCGRDGPPSPRRRLAHDTAPGNTHAASRRCRRRRIRAAGGAR